MEETWEVTHLIGVTDDTEEALKNSAHQELLLHLGLHPPDEDAPHWTIPATMPPDELDSLVRVPLFPGLSR